MAWALLALGLASLAGAGPQAAANSSSAILELNLANLRYSNLQGHGPDSGSPRGLRFRGVAWAEGTSLDLVVEAEDRYTPFDAGRNVNAGQDRQTGRINVKVGTHVELVFKLVRTGTDILRKVGEFRLSFVLADPRLELQVFEFADHCVSSGTRLSHDFSSSLRSLSLWSSRQGATLGSTLAGNGSSTRGAAKDIGDHAVTFSFRNTAGFGVIAYATGALEDAGADLLFTGAVYNPPWNCYRWSWSDRLSEGGLLAPPPGPVGRAHRGGPAFDCDTGEGPLHFRALAGGRCADAGMEPIHDRATCQAAALALHLPVAGQPVVCRPGPPEGCYIEIRRDSVSLLLAPARTSKEAEATEGGGLRRPLCSAQAWDDAKAKWCCKRKDVGCPVRSEGSAAECPGLERGAQPPPEARPADAAWESFHSEVDPLPTSSSTSSTGAATTTSTPSTTRASTTATASTTTSSSSSSSTSFSSLTSTTVTRRASTTTMTTTTTASYSTTSTTPAASTPSTSPATSASTTTVALDCVFLVDHAPRSSEIRKWCCREMGVGCSPATTTYTVSVANATAGLARCRGMPAGRRLLGPEEEEKEEEERRWCCRHWGLGCLPEPREVSAPLASPGNASDRGAAATTADAAGEGYDCSSSRDNPEANWTPAKKAWCRLRGRSRARPQRLFAWRPPLALPAGSLRVGAAAGAVGLLGLGFAAGAARLGRRPRPPAYAALPSEDSLASD